MVEFAVSKIPSNYIKIIDGQKVTDESFLSENPDLSKVMLFSKNEKTPPLFKALGIEYDQRLLLGEVKPSNKALAKKFNVTKFPSVIVSKHHEEEVNSIERYDGILKYKNLVEFFNTFAKEKKKEKKTDQKVKEEKKKGKETVLEFDPVIPQAKSLEDLKKFCYEQKKTCLISVLAPNEEDTLEETLSVLVETKKKFEKNFFSVYINILETPLFIPLLKNVFDVSDMYPSAVAVNFQRGWYRNFRGGFDAIGLASFLQDISKGKGKNSKIPDLTSFFNPVRSIVKDEL
ncbi:hypothetical protein HK099_004267 [Clydaea vesicula]|uniref:protein disulfide-isomerase n=1 Tax=Clydaea vesicula TaxID=447962 RepID=A0AAD5XYA8_9FUNG|nr:hypothetical protein HK099_004267 [Clydaea vesicula]